MGDSIIDLGGSEVIDLDTASPAQLLAAAAKLRCRPIDHRFEMLARNSSPPSGPQHNVESLNARRIDFDYEQDAIDARTAKARAEIERALRLEAQQAEQAKADVHSQLKERAGSVGRLLTRGFR